MNSNKNLALLGKNDFELDSYFHNCFIQNESGLNDEINLKILIVIYKIVLMKKILILLLCFATCSIVYAQTETKITWDYPVKPGSEEWRWASYDEKVRKSQPPKDLMDNWDTEFLFEYCINYPLNGVIWFFNNPNDGFQRAYEQSSVWQEFILRKDAVEVLVKYFETRPYKELFEMKEIKKRNKELFTLFFLEKLVSETDFVLTLDSPSKRNLANTILQTHQSKKDFPDDFFGFPYNSSLCSLLKILENDKVISSNDEISLTNFRKKTGYESFEDIDMESSIILKTVYYINKQQ